MSVSDVSYVTRACVLVDACDQLIQSIVHALLIVRLPGGRLTIVAPTAHGT